MKYIVVWYPYLAKDDVKFERVQNIFLSNGTHNQQIDQF